MAVLCPDWEPSRRSPDERRAGDHYFWMNGGRFQNQSFPFSPAIQILVLHYFWDTTVGWLLQNRLDHTTASPLHGCWMCMHDPFFKITTILLLSLQFFLFFRLLHNISFQTFCFQALHLQTFSFSMRNVYAYFHCSCF